MRTILCVVIAGACGLLCPAAAEHATFQSLGGIVGDISTDGSTVVGTTDEAYCWSEASGYLYIGAFVGSGSNEDGTAVAGYGGTAGEEAVRWTEWSGLTWLGSLPGGSESWGLATNSDGSVVVGRAVAQTFPYRRSEAFRWTEADGMIGLGTVGSGSEDSGATDVSSDGTVVVGFSGLNAFRWTDTEGMVSIGPGTAYGISSDGSVIVGQQATAQGRFPFRWTSETGMVVLDVTGASNRALASSGDGSVVTCRGGATAYIWDKTNGHRVLADVLAVDYGLDLTGWSLAEAVGVSDDALALAGNGSGGGWVARLPFAPYHAPWTTIASDKSSLTWSPVSGAISYNTYRGNLADLVDDDADGLPDAGYGECMNHLDTTPDTVFDTEFVDDETPTPGTGFFYVIGYTATDGQRGLGWTSGDQERTVFVACP